MVQEVYDKSREQEERERVIYRVRYVYSNHLRYLGHSDIIYDNWQAS